MTRHARSKVNFPEDIKDSFSMLIEMFHDMGYYEREMCLKNLHQRYNVASEIMEEYTPLLPYLETVHRELKAKDETSS